MSRYVRITSEHVFIPLTVEQLRDGGLFKWDIGLIVINPDSAFNGGYFKVRFSSRPYFNSTDVVP